jgi:hypothetical protein
MQVMDLDELKRSGALWQGRRDSVATERMLPSGWPVLDALLGGGWPRAALAEVLGADHQGLPLLLPLLASLSRGGRWLVWVAPPYVPYAPALAARGLRVDRLLLIRDLSAGQRLWVAEQALKSAACSAVLVWPDQARTAQLRRLQLAAEQGNCPVVLFRPSHAAAQGSPAALRLRVRPAPSGLEVEVLKRRAAWGGGICIVPLQWGVAPGPDSAQD